MLDTEPAKSQVGDYVIERELGRGGMGVVYAAAHADTGELVALKMICPHLLTELRQRQRFLREARAASRLRHPGLVRVHGHGEDPSGQPYLIMEYLEGCSLRGALTHAPGRRLPSAVAVQVAVQLADALDSIHQADVIHRDVKPSNIMLLDDPMQPAGWRVKLLDFGLAQLLSDAAATLTEGEVLGTPAYMSPEQCEGRKRLDGRSDVYALGVLLYEMTCGQTPFVGEPIQVMYQHVYQAAAPPHELQPRLGPELAELILQMLAKEPGSRPAMSAVRARLLLLAERMEANALGPAPASRPGSAHRMVGIGLLGLLGGLALGTLLRPLPGVGAKIMEDCLGTWRESSLLSSSMCMARSAENPYGFRSARGLPTHVQPAWSLPSRQVRKTASPGQKNKLEEPPLLTAPAAPPAAARPAPYPSPPQLPAPDSTTPNSVSKVEFWD